MDSAKELSVGFLRSHPEGAAPVLATITPEDAAAYLKDVPDDIGGRALECVQPVVAAMILAKLTRKKAAAVVLKMDVHGRSRIMRTLDDDLTKSIMNHMPKSAARDLTRFLSYPEGSAGAAMSSDVPVFEKSTKVGDCLQHLRALPDNARNVIFVTDGQSRLFGAVDLAELLAAPDDATIEPLAHRGVKRLSPYARLTSVVALPAWDTSLSLPVVDTKSRLLGALHFDRLREGLVSELRISSDGHLGWILAHVAEAFLVCAAGALNSPAAKPTISRPIGDLGD